jgi:hypothetical protein
MADIEKVLTLQKKTDSRTILSDHYHEFLNVFDRMMTEKLPPLRREDTDHQIELTDISVPVLVQDQNLFDEITDLKQM